MIEINAQFDEAVRVQFTLAHGVLFTHFDPYMVIVCTAETMLVDTHLLKEGY